MSKYVITYKDPAASYPAPKQNTTIESSRHLVWEAAIKLGYVVKIFDIDNCVCVVSEHWPFNYLGMKQKELEKHWLSC